MFQRSDMFLQRSESESVSMSILIKKARQKKGWTQKQLAHEIAVTPGFICKLEAEETFPSYERTQVLAHSLGLSFEELWATIEQEKVKAFQEKRRKRSD
jgi:ribosome-binding protein aMBF1 (putative translation factor)